MWVGCPSARWEPVAVSLKRGLGLCACGVALRFKTVGLSTRCARKVSARAQGVASAAMVSRSWHYLNFGDYLWCAGGRHVVPRTMAWMGGTGAPPGPPATALQGGTRAPPAHQLLRSLGVVLPQGRSCGPRAAKSRHTFMASLLRWHTLKDG